MSAKINNLTDGLSVIVPVYNEVDNVMPLYQEIVAALAPLACPFEVIFVDDGSQDGTAERLLKETYPHLKVTQHLKNAGQSAALLTGAKIAQYPLLVTIDGDGQNDPADIPRLLAERKERHQVIFGNRQKRLDNVVKRFSSWVGNTTRRKILKDDCIDTGCSLKIFPKTAFLSLPHFNHLHRFLPALFQRAGYTVVNVPVAHRPRRTGVSKYGVGNRLWVGIHDLIGVHWLMKRPCAGEIENERD